MMQKKWIAPGIETLDLSATETDMTTFCWPWWPWKPKPPKPDPGGS